MCLVEVDSVVVEETPKDIGKRTSHSGMQRLRDKAME